MSEFKYACPVCGQHMMCDSTQSGTTMECPTCFQKITAPQAPATDDPKFIITGTKVGERPIPAVVANAGTGLPVPEKSSSLPVIVFVVLFCAAAVMLFVFHGNIFKSTGGPANQVKSASNSSAAMAAASGAGNNIALNKPAVASSQEDQNPAQNGNDGNGGTRWCASNGNAPQWWEVDLGSTLTITNTQVIWELVSIYQYAVEVSSDHTNWTVVADRTGNLTLADENSDDFSASGRYVRIVVTGLQPGSWASFYEFRVFGSVGGGGDGRFNAKGNSTNQQ